MPTNNGRGLFQNLAVAILLTGLAAGALDGLAAIIQYSINGGKKPEVIFKYIASAALGKKAMTGGIPMILLGIFFHFLIAFLFTLFFYWIYPHIAFLRQQPLLSGIGYGLFAWAIMNFVVIPLSKLKQVPFDLSKAAIAAGILIICIGIPISLLANKHYLYKK